MSNLSSASPSSHSHTLPVCDRAVISATAAATAAAAAASAAASAAATAAASAATAVAATTRSAGGEFRFVSPSTSPASILSAATEHVSATTVYAADLTAVARELHLFRALLPNVEPHYAVKCNPDPVLIAFLAHLGASFDCASTHELQLVAAAVPHADLPRRVVFANPFKPVPDLRAARRAGVSLMTFDSVDELRKIAHHHAHAHLLLRIAVEDEGALCPLSSKFGARADEVAPILAVVRARRLRLEGLAFHVGSGCTALHAYSRALCAARAVADAVRDAGLPEVRVLDVGGGFPGYDGEVGITFAEIARVVKDGVARLFPGVRVIAEPGRALVTTAYTLAAQVVMGGEGVYWLSDGVYGSFRDALLLGVRYEARVLRREAEGGDEGEEEEEVCELRGPTREAVDVVATGVRLPRLKAGDWVWFANMGAYTRALGGDEEYRTVYYFKNEDGEADADG